MWNGNRLALIAAFGIGATPVLAETPARLDEQVRATAEAPSGLAFVRQQVRGGDLTAALAAVERVIILDPLNAEARLLHASILCRLDDRTGARAEFGPLRGHEVPDPIWREGAAPCEEPRGGAGQ